MFKNRVLELTFRLRLLEYTLHMKRFALLLLALSSLIACSPLALINNRVSPRNFIGSRNVSYGSLERQKLDVYQPRKGDRKSVV